MQVAATEQDCRPSRYITPTVMLATVCRRCIDGAMRMEQSLSSLSRSVFNIKDLILILSVRLVCELI